MDPITGDDQYVLAVNESTSFDVKVMVDGRFTWEMKMNDCLVVEAAAKPLRLFSSPHKGYFTILRNKLNWGGRYSGFPLPQTAVALFSKNRAK